MRHSMMGRQAQGACHETVGAILASSCVVCPKIGPNLGCHRACHDTVIAHMAASCVMSPRIGHHQTGACHDTVGVTVAPSCVMHPRVGLSQGHRGVCHDTVSVIMVLSCMAHRYVGHQQCSLLKCLYTNADQLVNKREDLCMAILGQEPDIILITEVIPKAQVLPIDAAVLADWILGLPLKEMFRQNPHPDDLNPWSISVTGTRRM